MIKSIYLVLLLFIVFAGVLSVGLQPIEIRAKDNLIVQDHQIQDMAVQSTGHVKVESSEVFCQVGYAYKIVQSQPWEATALSEVAIFPHIEHFRIKETNRSYTINTKIKISEVVVIDWHGFKEIGIT